MSIQNRIKELRYVKASDLRANPDNWRRHPERQKRALDAVLQSIGYADALIARVEDDGGLMLVDGHLRAETTPDEVVPVLVTDLTENEAKHVLSTLDPLASMAEVDADFAKGHTCIIDPFVGSGSTIIAAERQGYACYAMELEPLYVDMAVKRWEEYTGETAVRG